MKSIDLFCASPASTAICTSLDHRAIVRPLDRHRLGGGVTPRATRPYNNPPCSSQLPFDPSRPFRKPAASAKQPDLIRRKSSADAEDVSRISPPGSARYLLSDKPFFDIIQDPERGLVSSEAYTVRERYGDQIKRLNLDRFQGGFRSLSSNSAHESPVFNGQSQKYSASAAKLRDHLSTHKSAKHHQVVELRVSIHCKGCEGKLRKHISRMEGVTSFSIDLETKKVIVIGEVTPVGVLSSISKVKNAQFWPSPTSSSSTSSPRVSFAR